jgi:hypothetical protein
MTKRGPLRFIILAATGQDINDCTACQNCCIDEALSTEFDLSIWQVMAAAQKNDEIALTNRTIRLLAEAPPDSIACPNEVAVVAIARALCSEAQRRGLPQNVVK